MRATLTEEATSSVIQNYIKSISMYCSNFLPVKLSTLIGKIVVCKEGVNRNAQMP